MKTLVFSMIIFGSYYLLAAAQSHKQEIFEAAKNAEIAHYEWSLAQHFRWRLQLQLIQKKHRHDYSYSSDHLEKLRRWQEIEKQRKAKLPNKKELYNFQKQFTEPQRITLLSKYFQKIPLSPLRWNSIRKTFGQNTYSALIKKHFELKNVQNQFDRIPASYQNAQNTEIILISKNNPLIEKQILSYEKFGFNVHHLKNTLFITISDKAFELRTILLKKQKSGKKIILVSTDADSTVVHKLIDHFPIYRINKQIKAWININGNIYGSQINAKSMQKIESIFQKKSRGIASRANLNDQEILQLSYQFESQILINHQEIPLGKGFPTYNYVHKDHRPKYRHESLFMQTENYLYKNNTVLFSLIRSHIQ